MNLAVRGQRAESLEGLRTIRTFVANFGIPGIGEIALDVISAFGVAIIASAAAHRR